MIIFLYGADAYRRQEKTKELIGAYRQKHPHFDFKSFDFSEKAEDLPVLKDFLNQQSLFDNFKMALVRGLSETEPKQLKSFLKDQLSKENSALLISDAEKPPKALDFLLEKPVYSQEFAELKGEKSAFFLQKEAKKRNLVLAPEAVNYLIRWQEAVGAGSWTLINELDKAALADFPQPITAKHLENLIPFSFREKIFDLARILASPNVLKRKLVALERLLIQKEPAAYVFNLLGYQAPTSLLLKLADYDVSVKSGGLDYEEILLDLALG